MSSAHKNKQSLKYASPTVDIVFKKVFGREQNKPCLISLLNAILGIQIKDVTLQNTDQPAEFDGEKNARLDVLAELDGKIFVNIEVQVGNQQDLGERSLFYWARLYAGQYIAGKSYRHLKPVYTIFILDFKVFDEHDEFASAFVLKNKISNTHFFHRKNMLELHFLEIPKFKDLKSVPNSSLEKWMLFFRSKNNETLEDLKMSDPALERAVSEIELAKMSKAERTAYEARMFALSDKLSDLEFAEERGEARGEARGSHRARLEIFEKIAKKRFPKMSQKTHAKIIMLTDFQVNHQMGFILDYESQKEFEDAIAAVHAEPNS